MIVRPTQVPQQEERRPRREADLPRPRMEPRMERHDAPAFRQQPMPRMQEAPRQERAFREPPRPMPQPRMQPQQVRPVPGPSGGGRQGGGNSVRCRPGWPCGTEEVR